MPKHRHYHRLAYFASSLGTVLGLVLIWRGMWYFLDELDKVLFGSSHFLTGLGGILLGLAILYLPDKNLDELRKL